MIKHSHTSPRRSQPPVYLLRLAGFLLVMSLLATGCSPATTAPLQPAAETSAPTAADTATIAPSPTAAPTRTPEPTATPVPTETPAPTATPEPATEPATMAADTSAPTEPPATATLPAASGVTMQIRNRTERTLVVFGYGNSKSIPVGLTVYFNVPAWGEISLRICKKNDDDGVGSCYIYTGVVSMSNPLIEIKR